GVCHCQIRTYHERVGNPAWALMAAGTPAFSTFLYQSRPQLFRPLIPLGARHRRRPRRFTEVVRNEQSLPVASMKSSRSKDATSATRAKTSLAAMAAVAARALVAP